MLRPGSFSMSWRARSLQDFRDAGGTFESSSQYREGEWPYKAAGVAWVILVFVTIPVALPRTKCLYNYNNNNNNNNNYNITQHNGIANAAFKPKRKLNMNTNLRNVDT